MLLWYCENCKTEKQHFVKSSGSIFIECEYCGQYYILSPKETKDLQMDDATRKVKGSRAKKLSPGGIFFAHKE